MANKIIQTVPVNRQHFLHVIKSKNSSIRKLGDAYGDIGRTEKTIRRYLKKGIMPPDLIDSIAKYLDVHPDYLTGIQLKERPYLMRAKREVDYSKYLEDTLLINDITMKQFLALEPFKREQMKREIAISTLKVLAKYFEKDALGNNMDDELDYWQAMLEDFDPFSPFAESENLGIPEPNFRYDQTDFEKRMQEKHKNLPHDKK